MADRLTGADLRAFRTERGLTQAEAADRVGMATASWGAIERGTKPVSNRVDRAVRRLLAKEQQTSSGAPVEQPDGDADAPDSAPASEWAAGQTDLPPLAEPPDPDDDYVSIAGGKAVQISKLDHFARLELSILTLLAGKDIVYVAPGSGGKKGISHQPGIADLFPPADRVAVIDGAPRIAHAWAEWARTNKRIDALLSLMIIEGGFSGVVVATLPVVLTILGNHGLDPLGWISRQIAPAASPNGNGPAAASDVVDPYDIGTGPEFG